RDAWGTRLVGQARGQGRVARRGGQRGTGNRTSAMPPPPQSRQPGSGLPLRSVHQQSRNASRPATTDARAEGLRFRRSSVGRTGGVGGIVIARMVRSRLRRRSTAATSSARAGPERRRGGAAKVARASGEGE